MGAPFVYFEIAGPDAPRLKDFYSSIFDWQIDASSAISPLSTGGLRGGLREDPAEKVLYIAVDSIDDTLREIEDAGGHTVIPRTVVPGVVTFALFTDPAGNRMGLAEVISTTRDSD
jgi:predicted enzyme related to lactoylglutathione lyase